MKIGVAHSRQSLNDGIRDGIGTSRQWRRSTTRRHSSPAAFAAVTLDKLDETLDDGLDGSHGEFDLPPRRQPGVGAGIHVGQQIKVRAQSGQIAGIAGTLESDDQFVDALSEGLRRLQFIDDALHMRFVRRVAVEKR